MSLLSLSNINKSFLTEDIETHALNNINLLLTFIAQIY